MSVSQLYKKFANTDVNWDKQHHKGSPEVWKEESEYTGITSILQPWWSEANVDSDTQKKMSMCFDDKASVITDQRFQ